MDPGSLLGHYRISEPLDARGLEGFIAAEDTRDGSSVVLEPLPDWLARKRTFVDRLRGRGQALSTVDHPRLLSFRSVEEAEGAWFAVLPRVGGTSLDAGIPRNGIELERLFQLADELLEVLELMHNRGLFHGSLHPANVRFAEGGGCTVVVRASEAPEVAESGNVEAVPSDVGRLAYRAPEQLGDDDAIGPQADIFSCGALLYQLLTARRPFPDTSPDKVDRAIREETPVPVEEIRSDLPREIGQIVATCLEKDPAARYSSAWALRAHLGGVRSELGGGESSGAGARSSVARASTPAASAPETPPARDPASSPPARDTASSPSRGAPPAGTNRPTPAGGSAGEAAGAPAAGAAGTPQRPSQQAPATPAPGASSPTPGQASGGRSGTRPDRDAATTPRPAPGAKEPTAGTPAKTPATPDADPDESREEDRGTARDEKAARPAKEKGKGRRPPARKKPPEARAAPAREPAPPPRPAIRGWHLLLGAAVLLVVGFAAGMLIPLGGTGDSPVDGRDLTRATFLAGAEMSPSPAPDGNRIVYSRWEGENWSLHVREAGAREDRPLTAGSGADDVQPAVSPDGSRVAFRSGREGGGTFLVHLGDGETTRLADFGYNPAWSPDGERLAVAERGVSGAPRGWTRAGNVVLIEVASGDSRPLAQNAMQPSWSPAGDRVAFWRPHPATNGAAGSDIWTAGVEGEEPPVRLTDDPATDWAPAWSPDGRYLYYSSNRGSRVAIWRVPVDGSSGEATGPPEMVVGAGSARAHSPRFAADAGSMAYVEARTLTSIVRVPFDASRGAVTGSGTAVLEIDLDLATPDPEPRGDRVALVLDPTGARELYVVEEGRIAPLGPEPLVGRLPRWSPDGSRIAFLSDRGDGWQVWTARSDGGDPRQVSSFRRREIAAPAWSPDGSRVAVTAGGGFLPFLTFLLEAGTPAAEQAPRTLEPMQDEQVFEVHSWSPDGAWLAGTIRDPGGVETGIGVTPAERGAYERVTDLGAHPAWLPDSARLLFVSDDALYLADRRGGEPRELLRLTPDELGSQVSLSRDGRWVYLSRVTQEADVWVWGEPGTGG